MKEPSSSGEKLNLKLIASVTVYIKCKIIHLFGLKVVVKCVVCICVDCICSMYVVCICVVCIVKCVYSKVVKCSVVQSHRSIWFKSCTV